MPHIGILLTIETLAAASVTEAGPQGELVVLLSNLQILGS